MIITEAGLPTNNSFNKNDSISTAVINLVGDIMCHSVQFNYAKKEENSFYFDGVFSEVKRILSSADFTIGNFETVLAGKNKGYSGFPYFNAPDELLTAIKNAGFNMLVTANNHSIDKGESGIKRTIKKMDEFGIHHTGTFISETDRDSIRVYNIKDTKLAVIAYTYGTNGNPVPEDKGYLINLIDNELIKKDLIKAKEMADIVLVFYHFGNEYEREPNQYQKDIVKNTIEAGADIIIGSHPHVIQPVDYYKTNNGNIDSGFVAYSLGNFLSNQRWRYSDSGVILQLQISKNLQTGSVYLNKVSFFPTWVFKGGTDNGREYIILPSDLSYFDPAHYYLSKDDSTLMNQAYRDTKSVLTKYTDKIEQLLPDL
jgi:poly-gamma-glutamate synthesis protein (capsule biosynthesis protein)